MKILFIGMGSIGQRHLQNARKVFKNCDFYAYRKRGGGKVIKNTKIIKNTTIQTYYKIKEVFIFKIWRTTRQWLNYRVFGWIHQNLFT